MAIHELPTATHSIAAATQRYPESACYTRYEYAKNLIYSYVAEDFSR